MSPRAWQERIEDILGCARNIRDFTAGMSFEAFLDDPRTIRAVAYEFTTIGDAARAARQRSKGPETCYYNNIIPPGRFIFSDCLPAYAMQARLTGVQVPGG